MRGNEFSAACAVVIGLKRFQIPMRGNEIILRVEALEVITVSNPHEG